MCDNAHMNEPRLTADNDQRALVKRTLEGYLADSLVRIVINAKHPGVEVPLKHKGNAHLHLNLSFNYEGHRMAFDMDAFRVTLTFEGASFRVVIPYDAFLAASPVPREQPAPNKPDRSHLKVVK